MAFEGLSSRLQDITRKLKGKARITEGDLKEMLQAIGHGIKKGIENAKKKYKELTL